MNTILVVDTGTSSMRGIIYGMDGISVFNHSITYSMQLGPDGAAIMPAGVFADAFYEICARAACFAYQSSAAILAISLTSQRSSISASDKNGQLLTPFYMWFDKRSSSICDALNETHGSFIYQKSGMHLTPVSSAPKMAWLKRNDPDIYEKAYKLQGIHDYLLYLACGRHVTDHSLACRTALMDIEQRCWSDQLCALFGIDSEKLCTLVAPGSIVGELTPACAKKTGLPAGIPIISAGGDQQCSVLGQGVYEEGVICLNTGTASYLCTVLDKPKWDTMMQINLNASSIHNQWIAEASNTGSGILYNWFNREFFTLDQKTSCKEMDAAVMTVSPGSNGLLCVTDFSGRGVPDVNPDARGIFANIDLSMGRAHFARSILEGICYDICEAYEQLQQMTNRVNRIQSSGGLTKFTEFNAILADCIGQTIYVKQQPESTALGAFILAATAIGIYPSPKAFFTHFTPAKEVAYQPDPKRHQLYQQQLRKRRRLKECVQPLIFL